MLSSPVSLQQIPAIMTAAKTTVPTANNAIQSMCPVMQAITTAVAAVTKSAVQQ